MFLLFSDSFFSFFFFREFHRIYFGYILYCLPTPPRYPLSTSSYFLSLKEKQTTAKRKPAKKSILKTSKQTWSIICFGQPLLSIRTSQPISSSCLIFFSVIVNYYLTLFLWDKHYFASTFEWKHIVSFFLCLVFFIWNNVLQSHTYYFKHCDLIFSGLISFHSMYVMYDFCFLCVLICIYMIL